MTVYQLKESPERFKALQMDYLTLCDQLGTDDLLPLLMGHPLTNEPLLPHWREVSDSFQPLSLTSTEIPDVSLWGKTGLALTEKAFNRLSRYLESEGEFLPITVDGERMYIFNCLTFGKEDEGLCERKYLDGYDDGIKSLAFEEADVSQRFLFKSKLQGAHALYCSSVFKALYTELGLQGLRFDEDLLNPF